MNTEAMPAQVMLPRPASRPRVRKPTSRRDFVAAASIAVPRLQVRSETGMPTRSASYSANRANCEFDGSPPPRMSVLYDQAPLRSPSLFCNSSSHATLRRMRSKSFFGSAMHNTMVCSEVT